MIFGTLESLEVLMMHNSPLIRIHEGTIMLHTKGLVPQQGVQGSPANSLISTLEELNPEPFDRRKF
jgi:hypothetical protein